MSTPNAAAEFTDKYVSSGSAMKGGHATRSKTSIQLSIETKRPGALIEALKPFQEAGISITNVQNRPLAYESKAKYLTMFLDVEAHVEDAGMKRVIPFLQSTLPSVTVVGSWKTPWYPTEPQHLDLLDQSVLSAGEDLMDDPANPHPGFHDEAYKARRRAIAASARGHRHGMKIPRMEYTEQEKATWTAVYDNLFHLFPTHACKQFNSTLPLFAENAGFCRTELPQLQDVSDYIESQTGFTIRPVAGLLSSRDFFNALAFRIFFSTQYIRHHSQPLYTPEPDIVHEIIGHVPMMADPDFADFCQKIGFASLGASDEVIEELGRCYWYSVEFGLCKQGGHVRAYGSGILSSAGELQYCLSKEPQLLPWDPFVAAKMPFPITKYQPTYFVAEDFRDAAKKLEAWMDAQDRPFSIEYHPYTKTIRTFPKNTSEILGNLQK
eukprot:CAMPEP_0176472304 /NCGR_PEP_ID=MMETSP0127-20121128/41671_1 /TAXON_ID=938130 /ORGANISM="Platyophrya macrostoma, Strain WH" /LENGTH=436 /DNA_ID=CAMNT_0017867163 /DNA_START=144 /DNA_END=1454 /DNA_ORIENTATION=+